MPECVRKHAKMRRGTLESMLESDWGPAKTKKITNFSRCFKADRPGRRVWFQIPASDGFQTNEMWRPDEMDLSAQFQGSVGRPGWAIENFPPHGNQICVPVVPDETDGHGHEFPPRSATGAAVLIPLPRIGATAVVPPDRQSILEPVPPTRCSRRGSAAASFPIPHLDAADRHDLRMQIRLQNERQTPAWHWSRQIRDKPCVFGMAQKPGKR